MTFQANFIIVSSKIEEDREKDNMDEPDSEIGRQEPDLQISDLPGVQPPWLYSTLRQYAAPFVHELTDRPRMRSRLWKAATAACVLLLLAISLSGSFPQLGQSVQHLFSRPAAALLRAKRDATVPQVLPPTFYTRKVLIWNASTPPVVPVSATLDPLPRYCLQYTPTRVFDSSFAPGIGADPMWVTGFSKPAGRRAVLDHMTRAQPPQSGWYQQLQLVTETTFPGAITLQGGVVGSNLPLWFGVYPTGISPRGVGLINKITVRPFDPGLSNHTTGDQQWHTRPINIYIAEAGCYYLMATWAGGGWIVFFMAGR